ncbi:MAG TPA: hypothetical protein VJG64_02860 [Candidatus Paceibacterota bacterium]
MKILPHIDSIPTTVAGTTHTYDTNGNLTGASPWTYTWDYRNRLSASGNGATSTYAYDASDNRVLQASASATTTYPNRYYSITSATSTDYIFTGDTLLATIEAGSAATTTRYIHPDHLGSTNATTNASSSIIQLLDYYPYGKRSFTAGTDVSQREFIGEHFDETSSLS